ncbi:MAG: cobalamin-independent methionine synthase II family protein [Proteobacteria bacterium]|nr:cobalamin-independent methionine synthase II family protein [Pseudomonadota bacterium]
MPLLTTTIGAYPKPDFVELPDWFRDGGPGAGDPTTNYTAFMRQAGDDLEEILVRGAEQVVRDQVEAGIDVPTDGEIRRDDYIHYHCRHLDGIDFESLTEKAMRTGAWTARVPTVTGPIRAREHFLPREWRIVQAMTDKPVKVTVPGPMTVTDSIADDYYGDEAKVGIDVAEALNTEIRALAEAGCRWIQVDEPLFARWPDKALAYGIENLERCFHGAADTVVRTLHMCCGYPSKLDQEDYPKADRQAYFTLADALDGTSIQAVSIEDAHRPNDLGLLERFTTSRVILGTVAIAKTRVETVEEIAGRIEAALGHIDAERLIVAPDCGLGMLDRDTALAKLSNMTAAARAVA